MKINYKIQLPVLWRPNKEVIIGFRVVDSYTNFMQNCNHMTPKRFVLKDIENRKNGRLNAHLKLKSNEMK